MISRIRARLRSLFPNGVRSYSQCGEDVIMSFLCDILGLVKPTYLDIGAHHPRYLSNTYLFYRKGSRGVCVEPDPKLISAMRRVRPDDANLNVGIGTSTSSAKFYVMSVPTLNTFSQAEALRLEAEEGQKIVKVLEVELHDIARIYADHFSSALPDMVSLDVEGLDLAILKSMQLRKRRPKIICVETLTFSTNDKEVKVTEIAQFMAEMDYVLYADTYVNSIYVEGESWRNR